MTVVTSGIQEAQAALDDALRDINIESELMLSVILQGIAQHTMPYVPVHNSFLINSEYRTTEMMQTGPRGEIGFSAEYAAYIYNNSGKLRGQKRRGRNAKGRYWDNQGGGPGAQPRWLNLGVRDFIADDLSSVIARFQP